MQSPRIECLTDFFHTSHELSFYRAHPGYEPTNTTSTMCICCTKYTSLHEKRVRSQECREKGEASQMGNVFTLVKKANQFAKEANSTRFTIQKRLRELILECVGVPEPSSYDKRVYIRLHHFHPQSIIWNNEDANNKKPVKPYNMVNDMDSFRFLYRH